MFCPAEAVYDLHRRADDAEHTPCRVVPTGQVTLLNRSQRLGRCRVACQNDERTTFVKQVPYGFARKLINHLERARTVWSPCIIAQIDIVVVGKLLPDFLEDGQSAVTRIK